MFLITGALPAHVMEHSSVKASSSTRSDYLTSKTAFMPAGRMTCAHGIPWIRTTTTVYSMRVVMELWTAVLVLVVRGTAPWATMVSSHG